MKFLDRLWLGTTKAPHKRTGVSVKKGQADEKITFLYNGGLFEMILKRRIALFNPLPRPRIIINKTQGALEIHRKYQAPIKLPLSKIRCQPAGWFGYTITDIDTRQEYQVTYIINHKRFKEALDLEIL
jgi:hypothetical protein